MVTQGVVDVLQLPAGRGELYAVDASTGVKAFRVDQASSIYTPYAAAPVVSGNVVYWTAGTVLRAVNASTGAAVWGPVTLPADADPALALSGGVLYLQATCHVVAVTAATFDLGSAMSEPVRAAIPFAADTVVAAVRRGH